MTIVCTRQLRQQIEHTWHRTYVIHRDKLVMHEHKFNCNCKERDLTSTHKCNLHKSMVTCCVLAPMQWEQ